MEGNFTFWESDDRAILSFTTAGPCRATEKVVVVLWWEDEDGQTVTSHHRQAHTHSVVAVVVVPLDPAASGRKANNPAMFGYYRGMTAKQWLSLEGPMYFFVVRSTSLAFHTRLPNATTTTAEGLKCLHAPCKQHSVKRAAVRPTPSLCLGLTRAGWLASVPLFLSLSVRVRE